MLRGAGRRGTPSRTAIAAASAGLPSATTVAGQRNDSPLRLLSPPPTRPGQRDDHHHMRGAIQEGK